MKMLGTIPGKRVLPCLAAYMLVAWTMGCTPPCPPTEPVELPEHLIGVSQGRVDDVGLAAELGVGWMRAHIAWDDVEPEIYERLYAVCDVDENPELVLDYIDTHDWSVPDTLLTETKNHDLEPLIILGHGYTHALPYFEGARLTPNRFGRMYYLGHLYLHARAVVERYDGDGEHDAPGGLVVKFWQLENELNQAFLTALWGWRTPSYLDAVGSAWQRWDFVTDVLETLSRAVRIEDPEALTMVNFHTDVPEALNHGFLLPSWPESIRLWIDHIDVVGIDAYPNYYSPEPVRGEVLGERVAIADEMGCGKPVVVVETGYPTGPAERGFTEVGQALYIQEAYDAAMGAGAQGFFLFGLRTSESHTTEITPEDVENLAYVIELFEAGNFRELFWFALFNAYYLQDHFVKVLWTVEPYWGLVRSDGTHKLGWDVLQAIASTEIGG